MQVPKSFLNTNIEILKDASALTALLPLGNPLVRKFVGVDAHAAPALVPRHRAQTVIPLPRLLLDTDRP